MEEEARLINLTLCQLSHSLSQSQTTLIIINKERSKLSMFGGREPIEVTLHRNALKTYASMRLNMRMIGPVKRGVETVGSQVQVKIMKNKLAFSCGTAEFELVNRKGICRESEIINLGLKYKLMSEDGAFYSFNGQSFLDKDALKKFLSVNQDAREELIVKLKEKLNANLK